MLTYNYGEKSYSAQSLGINWHKILFKRNFIVRKTKLMALKYTMNLLFEDVFFSNMKHYDELVLFKVSLGFPVWSVSTQNVKEG